MTLPTIEGEADVLALHEAALKILRKIADRKDERAEDARTIARTVTAVCNHALGLEKRIEGLRDHCDREGGAKITLWANEMWECEGLWASEDVDDETPAMYDSLDDLLDALSDKRRSLSVQRAKE